MAEEQNNPFAEFGGEVVKKETNPFAEFGGELKKKEKSTPSGYSVTPLPSQDKFKLGREVADIGYKSPIGKAIEEDKNKYKGSNVAGIYNTLVGSLGSLVGGSAYLADILAAPAAMPLSARVATAQADRKKVTDFIEQARIEKGFPLVTPTGIDWVSSSKEFEQQQGAFDVTPKKGGGLLSGVDWEDVKGLAFQAPKTLVDMAAGGVTGGYSFFAQSINDNAKELEESGAANKLSDTQKVGYLFTQAAAQAALEYFSVDKILKNTGLAKSLEKKITSEVINEFAQKGIKATAKDIEDAMFKKAAKLSTKIKNVGIKGLEDALVEGTTEGVQQAASDAIKVTTNKIAEKEVFNEEDINKNFWKNIVNNAVMGAAMGGVAGAGLQGLNSTGKAIRQEIANATGEKKFYVDDKEVTEKEFNQATGNKKVTTDLQHIQDQINKQVEEGNLTPEEAEAANITAQQYAEIAGKIPTTVSPEDKYKIIGGISQRNKLQEDLQKARDEMMQVDPIFRKEKQDQIDLIQAKIDETGDYLEGLATGKKPRYIKRDGRKGEETTYYKVDENGERTSISQARYELAKAIKKEDSRKKAPADENRRRRVEQFDILYNVKSNNPEFDFPDTFQEFNKKIDTDPNYLPDLYRRAQKYKQTGEITEDELGTEASFIEAINPPVEKDITIGEIVDKKGTYKGQKGTFLQEGDNIIFENKDSGEKYEVGKASEIQEKPASEFDIKYDESLVSIDEKGNINVREKPYINRYSNPLKAINKDEDGNIVSVNLETADGKKRTFKGAIAEDIAYQINLKEKSKEAPKVEPKAEQVVVEPIKPVQAVEVKEEVKPVEVKEEAKPKTKVEEIKTKIKSKLESFKERFAPVKKTSTQGEKIAESKDVYKKVKEMDAPADAEQIGLRYLADGGKVSQAAVDEIAGSTATVRATLNTGRKVKTKSEEAKARDYVEGNESLDDLAHRLWEVNKQRVPEDKIKEALMTEIGDNNTRFDAAKSYLERYSPEYKQKSYEERQSEQMQAEEEELKKRMEEEGIEEAPFAVKEATTEDVEAMQDIVADYVKNGVTSLEDIKREIVKELGYNTKALRQIIEDAYNNYTKTSEASPAEIVNDLLRRIGNKMTQMFGKAAQKPYIAQDDKDLKVKYKDISETGGRIAFQATMPNGEKVIAKPVDASVVNGFYSPLELQINQMKQDKMPAKQWLDKLRGEEAKWTGLADWLSQQEGSLTKEEIKNWLQNNQIQINEIIKGEPDINNKALWQYRASGDGVWYFMFDKGRGGYLKIDASEGDGRAILYTQDKLSYGINEVGVINYTDRDQILDMALERNTFENYIDDLDLNSTKYSKYTLEGKKKDYKEILITYPTPAPVSFEEWNRNRISWGEKEGTLEEYKKAGILYKSSHFDEKNILVHVRSDIRTDAKGNKIYFIEEVQSDWGQAGKKLGFEALTLKEVERFNELKSIMPILQDAFRDTHWAKGYAYKYDISTSVEEFYKLSVKERKDKINETHQKFQDRTNKYIVELQKEVDKRNKKINENIDEGLLLEKEELKYDQALRNAKNNKIIIDGKEIDLNVKKEYDAYKNKLEELDVKIRNLEQESVKLENEISTDSKMIANLNNDKELDNFEYERVIKYAEITFDQNEYTKLTNEYTELKNKAEKTTIKKAPFVTKTNDWAKLGLKIALKNAVNEGATKIAWTNGEQQNERYDLSKQVNYIERIPENDINKEQGDFYLDINLPNGIIGLNVNKDSGIITRSTGSVYMGDLLGKNLSDIIGKDMSDKVMSNGAKKYEGDGLKIGGKGMIGFYGSPENNTLGILGDLAKSLYKQNPEKISFDDIKENKLNELKKELEEHTNNKTFWFEMADMSRRLGDLEEARKNEEFAKKSVEYEESVLKDIKKLKTEYQYSINITPELKAQVEQGLPLFMANPSGTDVLGFSFNKKMYLNGEKLNPNTPIHEASHIWTEWIKDNDTKIYEKGMELVEKSPYLQKAKNSKFYQEQAQKLTTEQEREEYFKHEALAMAIGDKGAQFVLESKKESFQDWLKTLWNKIKNLTGFKDLTAEEFQNLTFEQFSKMAVKEILGTEGAVEKLNAIKSFRNKKKFIKDNLKYESNKNAIDELDFTEEDLIEIAKSNFDLSTFKNIKDAVQKRSAEKILQRPQRGVGEARGGRKRMEPTVEGEGIAREGEKGQAPQPKGITQIPEEIQNVGLENGDVDYVGITAADLGALRKSLGLPPYKGLPLETHEMLREAAQEMVKNGKTIQSLYDKIRRGDVLSNYENAFMAEYRAALDLELKNNPSQELLAKISEFADIFQQGASLAGKALESLKIMKKLNEANTLSNFLLTRQEDKGYPLTPKMIVEETTKFEKVQKAKEQLSESVDNDIEEQLKAEAEKELKKETKAKAKKSHEEFVKERKAALSAAREAVNKIKKGGGGLMVSAPYLPQLIAAAPHMNKYVKSLFAEGISKLDDIVTEVHNEFSDLIDGLTKRDVLDVIAGKYNLKKRTPDEINAGLRLLRRESELLIKLEQARKGEEEAKSESQMAERSRRVQELERKIKEVKELNRAKELAEEGVEEKSPTIGKDGVTDADYNQKRQKYLEKKIKKLEEDLKNKNYDKEPKEALKFKVSDKTKKMMDKVIELEKAIALERYKDQTNKLSKWEKAWDKIQSVLGVRRIVQTAVDASIWFRQLAKLTLNPGKWDIARKFIFAGAQSVFSQKNYDRLMYGIHQAPDFEESVKDGIRYNELDSIDPKKQNEMFPKSFVFKIPILRELITASQRIADASLNVARYELYNKYKKELLRKGITRESDPEMYEAMAKLVMNSTGSGNMLKFLESRQGEKVMGSLFYGARLMAANMNTLNPVYYVRMPKEVRTMAMKDLASYTATVIATTLAFAAAGGAVSMDPDDPEFLQVRFNGKVYDFTAGQAAYIRTFLRWVEFGYARATKSKFEANEAGAFAWKSTLSFFRNKLAPNNAYLINAATGKNSIGQDFDPMEVFHVYPMYADDAYQAAKEDGFVSLLTVLMPNMLGIGYSSYYSDKAMKPMDEVINRAQNSDELNPESVKKGITKKEFEEFVILRDKLIAEKITKLYKEGIYGVHDGIEEYVPIKKSTPEEITEAIMKAKTAATKQAKKQFNIANEEE